jgi:hypothetical protein
MAPTNKDLGATRMAGAHIFQAEGHPKLGTLSLASIRDFLKKRARYLWLLAQNNKGDVVKVTTITFVASVDPKLLENLFDMKKIDADSVDDSADESIMKYLYSTQEKDATVTAETVKAEVLSTVCLQCRRKILRYESRGQLRAIILCAEIREWISLIASRRKQSSIWHLAARTSESC